MTGQGFEIEPCSSGEAEAALQVLYQWAPEKQRSHLVAETQSLASTGAFDLSGLWIARGGIHLKSVPWRRGVVGVLLSEALAGCTAAIWAPEVKPRFDRAPIAAALVRAAILHFRARGFRVVQAVLDESANARAAGDLAAGGMRQVTELLYLQRDARVPLVQPTAAAPGIVVDWRPYAPRFEAELRRILEATYVSSLDMPELDGHRAVEAALAKDRASGRFEPWHWQLGRVRGQPEAAIVLLLAEVLGHDIWEITYLGLAPEARGRGLGRLAVARALELASGRARWLQLSVDVRNIPAIRLYEATGFLPFDRRFVHLLVFPDQDDAAPGHTQCVLPASSPTIPSAPSHPG